MGDQISLLRPVTLIRRFFGGRNGDSFNSATNGYDGSDNSSREDAIVVEESIDVNSVEITIDSKSKKLDLTTQRVLNDELFYKALSIHESPTHVQELTLRNKSKVTAIPVIIGHFENLVTLNLSKNGLTDLPWSVLYLGKLQKLDLSQNLFQHIPRIVGYLKELRELNFKNNHLLTLPNELLRLEKLQKFDLAGNDQLKGVTAEQIKKGVSAIFELIRKRQDRNDLWVNSTPWIGHMEAVTYGSNPLCLHEIAVLSILSHKVNFLVFDHVPPRLKTMLNERADEYRNRIKVAKCSKCKYFYSTKEMFENHICQSA